MKKLVLVLFIFVFFVIINLFTNVFTDPKDYVLSSEEITYNLERAKMGDEMAINKLILYFNFYKKDRKSVALLMCHGRKMKIQDYMYKEEKVPFINKCPQDSIDILISSYKKK